MTSSSSTHTPAARVSRIAADIGGTFTDIAVLTTSGELATRKLPSTPPNFADTVATGVDTITEDMALTLMRTAHSSIVRDWLDFSTSLCDAEGQPLAQGVCTPMHLGSLYDAMRKILSMYEGSIFEGDIFISNDPYEAAGQHLADIYIAKPIFHQDRLVAWAVALAHRSDAGGIVAGSNALGAYEIFQEGLRLPILKFLERGVPNQALRDVIAINVRTSDKVMGDLQAQISSCLSGEREFLSLVGRYGIEEALRYADHLQDYAEALTAAELRDIPDGTGLLHGPYRRAGQGTEAGGLPRGGHHRRRPRHHRLGRLLAAGEERNQSELSFHQGLALRGLPLAYEGGRAKLPRLHQADRGEGPARLTHEPNLPGPLRRARHLGLPDDRLHLRHYGGSPARPGDSRFQRRLHGDDHRRLYRRQAYVFCETFMGAWGGAAGHDGQNGLPHTSANQANVPVEMIEAEYPIRIERYGLVPDTGGPGRNRGGLSLTREHRLTQGDAILSVRSDKRNFPPHGPFGGQPGAPSWNIVNPDGERRVLPVLMTEVAELAAGDLYQHIMSSGGGFGDPLDRDSARLIEDVRDEKVSVAHARKAYGVVISGSGRKAALDHAATEALRAERQQGASA